ncbi:MAG TPA: nucleotidyltransferase [Segetibacter sp.]|jgi:predicted nucleotidyltransferase
MDIFDEEIIKFWKCLLDNAVRYIMVGGYATNLNGYQRFTGDIDIWIEDTVENRRNLRKAFADCEMGDYYMLETMQIIPGWTSFNLNNGLRLDIMLDVKGLEGFTFQQCLDQASNADIDGVTVPFLHINHLIDSKKAANRPKDRIDVIYLEKIKQLLEQQGGNI